MLINDENSTEVIDAYLDGRLDAVQIVEFETELKSNQELRMEMQAQKAVRKNMVLHGRIQLKMKLKELHQEMLDEINTIEEKQGKEVFLKTTENENSETILKRPAIFSYRSRTMYAIASAVLVLMVSTFALLNYRENKLNELAMQGKAYKVEMKELEQTALGFGGQESPVSDSLVLFIKGDEKYNFHYQFTDTLTIFSKYLNPEVEQIYLEHHTTPAQSETYTLVIDGKRYPLERGFIDINPLKQENKMKK
jgi:hypothetical protein